MKRFMKTFEDTMAAAAFAEAGEFDTAREILKEEEDFTAKVKTLNGNMDVTVDNLISMAITFAEAGEHKRASEFLEEAENQIKEVKEKINKESHVFSTGSA